MSDRMWSRNVRARLSRQYPRIAEPEVQALVDVWLRVLDGKLPEAELEAAVEEQVRTALRALCATLPRQRARVPVGASG